MKTELLFQADPFRKECDSKVIFVEFTDLVVDSTVLYPTGDGQPNDKGSVTIDGKDFEIVDTWQDGTWVHLISLDTYPQNIVGNVVHQTVNWDVRYIHMRFRTALFIIGGLAYKQLGATVRINQTYDDQAWIDINFDGDLTEEQLKKIEADSNAIVQGKYEVKYSYVSKEQFSSDSEMMKINRDKLPDYEKIRMVKIDDLPLQHDIGTQVSNTGDVGKIVFKTTMVKGKLSKRVTITLE
ncbi:Alanyl-tRNA deacylase AlaX-M [Thermoplasmatales archaeon]|nr:Alanyl-tRNA deacylase AlaX-M [Thermoplasmatales archaeon]